MSVEQQKDKDESEAAAEKEDPGRMISITYHRLDRPEAAPSSIQMGLNRSFADLRQAIVEQEKIGMPPQDSQSSAGGGCKLMKKEHMSWPNVTIGLLLLSVILQVRGHT